MAGFKRPLTAILEYLKEYPFPEDKTYSQKEFIEDAAYASGYIHLWVEKEETAEFIAELIHELI